MQSTEVVRSSASVQISAVWRGNKAKIPRTNAMFKRFWRLGNNGIKVLELLSPKLQLRALCGIFRYYCSYPK